MTHLIWRNGRAYFRYRLPPELRAIPKPPHWPQDLKELVSEAKPTQLKHELSRALNTREERLAKRRAAAEVVRAESLIHQAMEFLKYGPRPSISEAEIASMAAQYGSQLIKGDLDLRQRGIGLRLPRPTDPIIRAVGGVVPGVIDKSEPGLTQDDLGLLKFAVAQTMPEIKQAIARQRPPQMVKDAVSKALAEVGIVLEPHSPERRKLELAFLEQHANALEVWAARNEGKIISSPEALAQVGRVPTIQQAFEVWKTGSGARGEKLPSKGAIEEAAHAVRRFRELHGNLFISDITPAHARAFRDAVAKMPPRLPLALQRLPLPKLLESRDLPLGRPAAPTVNKKLTLLKAILSDAALHYGLKGGGVNWHNPFESLMIVEAGGAKNRRSRFSIEDLKTLIHQPFIFHGDKPGSGGKGLAARWLPLLAMFTGARRRELAQLKLQDIMSEDGVVFLYITDLGDDQSVKASVSVRRVPLHPELVKCGFLRFVEARRSKAKAGDWLFEHLGMNRKGDRGDAWGRWFGRQLKSLSVDAGGRKVFHSFRHTFIARCREAEIEEEIRFALTGHSDGDVVGRGYGGDESGFRHSVKRLHREISKISYPGLDLSHLYPP